MVIAKYLRFSNDDGKETENESIKNQRDLLDRYISESDDLQSCDIVEFLDDGFTGMNFQRPGFMSMMDAVKEQKIGCVIVKDFSRFGRNYIEVSDYIDQIFPFLGVRFIAVNENYDSKTAIAALGVDMAMKNIIYDLYSKDLSVKVKSARKALMKKGDYIAPFAIYGYTNKVEKKKLVVDPPAAEIVKRMFEYAVNGDNARKIALRLNDEGVMPPNAYNKNKSTKKQHYIPMDTTAIWTGDIVRRILQDERYTGTMVCGKYERRRGGKTTLVPKDDWVRTPGTHEAIVSDEIFRQAQKIFRTRKEITMPDKPKSILVGMLKCVHCNKSIVFEGRYNRRFYCHTFNMGIGCEQAKIGENVLIDVILTAVKIKLELVQASEQAVIAERKAKSDARDAQRREYELRLKKLKFTQSNTLEQYLEGKLTKDEFQSNKAKIADAIQETTDRLAEVVMQTENASEFIESHKPFFGQETLTREMAQALIKEVRITSADEIEIVWKFCDFYNQIQCNGKVALYCRLASASLYDTDGVEAQREILRNFAEEQGFITYTEYCDNGYNGLTLDRPAFVQMDTDITAGKIDTVIVRSIDRIARDFILANEWIDSLKNRNAKIIAVDGSHELPIINFEAIQATLRKPEKTT